MDKNLENNYDDIVNQLYLKEDNNYHMLETIEGNEFKIIKSSDRKSVV